MKTRPLEPELFHADGRTDGRTDSQTDMTKIIVAVRNSANDPQNDKLTYVLLYFIVLQCSSKMSVRVLCCCFIRITTAVRHELWQSHCDWVTSSDRNFCCYHRIRTSSGAKPAPLEPFKWWRSSRKRHLVTSCRHLVPFLVRDYGALLSLLVRLHGVVVRHRAGLIVALICEQTDGWAVNILDL
jgi:hypothetical protein